MWDKIDDLGSGILVYRNTVKKELKIVDRITNLLNDDPAKYPAWQPAYVGYNQLMPDYRDCNDFKFKKQDLSPYDPFIKELGDIWQDCYDAQLPAVHDYCRLHNISELRYWEAFNFIRYKPGQHFQEHHDHGFSYNCTVSLVTYLNDDYEGGGLLFTKQGIEYKPQAGDTVIFPSNFMYPHVALPVLSGTKYSLVTMLDYSDKYHRPEFYQEIGS
jgi:hypothetical protein